MKHQFHNTIISPYTSLHLHARDQLSAIGLEYEYIFNEQRKSFTIHLLTTIKNPNNPRFISARQENYGCILRKIAGKTALRSKYQKTQAYLEIGTSWV